MNYTNVLINVFPQKGDVGWLPQGIRQCWKNLSLIPYPCGTILCPKSPGHVFKFKHNFFDILSLKNLRSHPYAKVVCQIPKGSDCFGSHIPRVSPPPALGKTFIGAQVTISAFWRLIPMSNSTHNALNSKASQYHQQLHWRPAQEYWHLIQLLWRPDIKVTLTIQLHLIPVTSGTLEARHLSNTDHTTPLETRHLRNTDHTTTLEACHLSNTDHTTPLEARHLSNTDHTTPLEARHLRNTDHTTTLDARHLRNTDHITPLETCPHSNTDISTRVLNRQWMVLFVSFILMSLRDMKALFPLLTYAACHLRNTDHTSPLKACHLRNTDQTTAMETRHHSNTNHTTPFDAWHLRNTDHATPLETLPLRNTDITTHWRPVT